MICHTHACQREATRKHGLRVPFCSKHWAAIPRRLRLLLTRPILTRYEAMIYADTLTLAIEAFRK